MARDWVKLYTAMLDDHALGAAPPLVGWTWCRLIMLAGRKDADGALGTADEVAWVLRMPAADLAGVLAALNGRVAVTADGLLRVRDWADWQAPKDARGAERQARYMARQRAGVTDGVSDASASVSVTALDKIRIEERENRQEQTNGVAAVPAAASAPAPDGARWAPFYELAAAHWGESAYTGPGRVRAHYGRMAVTFGRWCDDDVDTACRLFEAWRRDPSARFAQQPTLAPPKQAAWLDDNAATVLAVEMAVQR